LIGSKIHVKVKKILRICHKKFCEYGPCKTISKENEKQTKKYLLFLYGKNPFNKIILKQGLRPFILANINNKQEFCKHYNFKVQKSLQLQTTKIPTTSNYKNPYNFKVQKSLIKFNNY